jgi:hypothetical protein
MREVRREREEGEGKGKGGRGGTGGSIEEREFELSEKGRSRRGREERGGGIVGKQSEKSQRSGRKGETAGRRMAGVDSSGLRASSEEESEEEQSQLGVEREEAVPLPLGRRWRDVEGLEGREQGSGTVTDRPAELDGWRGTRLSRLPSLRQRSTRFLPSTKLTPPLNFPFFPRLSSPSQTVALSARPREVTVHGLERVTKR